MTTATTATTSRRRAGPPPPRKRRRGPRGCRAPGSEDDPPNTVVHVRDAARAAGRRRRCARVKGSTRLEAKRQRRRDGRETGRRRPPILTEAEFLARREAVDRVMVVRAARRPHPDRGARGRRARRALRHPREPPSYVGNVYLGRVQNVLPSMEAAFVDIGKGRNAVLYAGEVNLDASGLEGQSTRDRVRAEVRRSPSSSRSPRTRSGTRAPG